MHGSHSCMDHDIFWNKKLKMVYSKYDLGWLEELAYDPKLNNFVMFGAHNKIIYNQPPP